MGGNLSVTRKRHRGPQLLKHVKNLDEQSTHEVLEHNPGAAAYCTLEGQSCLHAAAAARRADLLEQLLSALHRDGARRQPKAARRAFSKAINQKNVHGQTPLMLACRAGAADCVRLLLEAGGDATLFDDLQQRTCLHYAALHGWAEAVEALLEDESAVVLGVDGQRQPLREALIPDSQGHHRYIDGREGFGLAPLHLAATHGHLAAVKALLKWGASLTVRCNTSFGMGGRDHWTPLSTPLHYAAAGGKGRVVHAILQAAAERRRTEPRAVDIRLLQDIRGQRPYDVAASMRHHSLLWALNPRVPLAALLQQPAAQSQVPSLAALAAATLRALLVRQLGQLAEAVQAVHDVHSSGTAAAAGGEASRHGLRSSGSGPASREGSAHGGTAYAAVRGLPAAVLARININNTCMSSPSVSCLGQVVVGSGTSGGPAVSDHRSSVGAVGCRGGRHRRTASDSSLGGSLLTAAASPTPGIGSRAGLSGSWRGGTAYASLFPTAANPGSPLAAPSCAPADSPATRDAGGSVVGCPASTSVTSVAGCPVCLDSHLEVAALPCRHGLCMECALHLSAEECAARHATAPLCPMCRGVMGSFRLI